MKDGMKKPEKTRWNLDKIFESLNSWFMGLGELKKEPIFKDVSAKVSKNLKMDQNFHKYFISKKSKHLKCIEYQLNYISNSKFVLIFSISIFYFKN
jgi:hypothetical protein